MNNFEKMIESIKKIIKIDSVKTEAKQNMPFGEGIFKALNHTLALGEKLGFTTFNYDNYIGEIVWKGEVEESMAILCHLDVVPIGNINDWKYPPFSATETDGKIYGRGATDDKSPAICILYCMKELMDNGFTPHYTIKLILGCDEESGWACIDHYKKVATMPKFGFSPDADFPVLYAEKGIISVKYTFDCTNDLYFIEGGTRSNVVCDLVKCQCLFDGDLLSKYGLYTDKDYIISKGKTAHGSTPEKGKNAIKPMLEYLSDIGAISKDIVDKLFYDSLGLTKMEDDTGHLTMSPDIINKVGNKIEITVDYRYPSTYKSEYIIDKIKDVGQMEILHHQLPLYNDKNSKMIKTLLNIYNEEMKQNLEPIAIGGGTYARALECGVAFGPEFPARF